MKKTLNNLSNKKGQGVMEYIILSSLIGIFCLGLVSIFGQKLKTRLNWMVESIEKIEKAKVR